jgi:hypothetical protein
MNECKMLDRRFSVAPLMDWTGTSQKAKHHQHLSVTVVTRAVPNAVLSSSNSRQSKQFRVFAFIRLLRRKA